MEGGADLVPLVGLPPDVASAGEVHLTEFASMPSGLDCMPQVVPDTPRCAHALNSVLTKLRVLAIERCGVPSVFGAALGEASHGVPLGSLFRLEFSTPAGAPVVFISCTPPIMVFAGSAEAVGGGKTFEEIDPDAPLAAWQLSDDESTRLLRATGRLWFRCHPGSVAVEGEADDDALGSDFEVYRKAELNKLDHPWSMTPAAMRAAKATIRAAYIAAHGGGGGGGSGDGGEGGGGDGGGDGGGAGGCGGAAAPAT